MVFYIKHNNSVCDTFLMHQHSLKSVKYMHKWIESRDQKKKKTEKKETKILSMVIMHKYSALMV